MRRHRWMTNRPSGGKGARRATGILCLPGSDVGSSVAPARPRSGRAAGDAAEHGAIGEAGTARIIEIEDAAHHLACGVETGDGMSIRVDDAGGRVDLDAAKGEGQPA